MRAVLKLCAAGAVSVGMLFFAGCNSEPTPAASDKPAAPTVAAPPELVSAKTAFNPMYKSAFTWANDVVLIAMKAQTVPGFTNKDGKAAMWEATWASPSQNAYRIDTYAIITKLPDIHKGASAGMKLPWSGATREAMPIEVSTFQIDSDAAYKAAAADADEFLKKNPDKPLTAMELGAPARFHGPVWYISWGDQKSGGYVEVVDATTGKVLKK